MAAVQPAVMEVTFSILITGKMQRQEKLFITVDAVRRRMAAAVLFMVQAVAVAAVRISATAVAARRAATARVAVSMVTVMLLPIRQTAWY